MIVRTKLTGMMLCALLSYAPIVQAQTFGRVEQTETNLGSYYHFAQRGTATVQVYVLGAIASPGIYEISQGTNLEKLLVLAKPDVRARQSSGTGFQRSRVIIRLYRHQADGRALVYEAQLEEAIANPADHPILSDGDVLMVEVKETRFDWRDLLRVAQAVAVFGLAIERFANMF